MQQEGMYHAYNGYFEVTNDQSNPPQKQPGRKRTNG
jgi:hypothetical protein